MKLWIAPRAGIWCRSTSGWDAFSAAVAAGIEPDARLPEPVPDLLPAREGRRAPLHVRLALEAAAQACRENGVPLNSVLTVFASAMGDIQITDYMCRTLATESPMLSPTKFHNSVHNAASGYWAIGAENRLASTAIAAGENSFGAGLLEAAMLAGDTAMPVLLVAYDVPAPGPLIAVSRNRQAFSCGVILSNSQVTPRWRQLDLDFTVEGCQPEPSEARWPECLAGENDSGIAMKLIRGLAQPGLSAGALGVARSSFRFALSPVTPD
jgi:Beta-ketoacyl synthase, N-terminal domain